ncbi:RNA-binding NOB1-like protein isoform X3 [Arachis hypogaea]|uniref:RNA-binding NOB1-like protein isoform X3 n=2 Tax=Arachis hypogaea TaxID=3818 RepID=UPI003B20F500
MFGRFQKTRAKGKRKRKQEKEKGKKEKKSNKLKPNHVQTPSVQSVFYTICFLLNFFVLLVHCYFLVEGREFGNDFAFWHSLSLSYQNQEVKDEDEGRINMEDQPPPAAAAASSSSSCWSSVLKNQATAKPPQQQSIQNGRGLVESSKSAHGVSVAVVDANAVIDGGEKLHSLADKFVSVPEVMEEIRDPVSRHKLSFLPFTIDTMEPTPEAINKVVKFARATGDLQTLSDIDLKLIALTYTLEAQIHGTQNLRESPPPVQTVNVPRLPEKDMPGWGSNVPNMEEWEALEHQAEDKSNSNSRILPLRDLNLNVVSQEGHLEDGSAEHKSKTSSYIQQHLELGSSKPKKKEINIEGKIMVAAGIDASQGQVDGDEGDWMPAVSRSTHRRFLRRKARRELYDTSSNQDQQQDLEENADDVTEDAGASSQHIHQNNDENHIGSGVSTNDQIMEENESNETLPALMKQMMLEGSPEVLDHEQNLGFSKPGETDTFNGESNHLDHASQTSEATDLSYADDDSSEQNWMVRPLSESSVACATGDFAMQNVLLQMGLRLLAPGGSQIHQLHRWILMCHACCTVTADIGRIFCPKCGNGGTLRKVAVTVGENGIVMAARRPRVTLRGTKFSLPLPKGGRDAVTKNLILREDQLPQRVLYPKTKKASKKDDDIFASGSVFTHHTDKRAPFHPPIRKALAVFSGRRNPNDNHYSGSRHK